MQTLPVLMLLLHLIWKFVPDEVEVDIMFKVSL